MQELELLGAHPDGNQLILNDENGKRYALPITQSLREALKNQVAVLQAVTTESSPSPTPNPKEIQSLVRSGMELDQIAKHFGVSLAHVQQYSGPILQERQYMASKAQNIPISSEPGAPTLGDLTVDRLAARGVMPSSLRWDATRNQRDPWQISLTFIQNARELCAHWQLNSSGSLEALDQEAIWISESTQPASYSNLSKLSDFLPSDPKDTAHTSLGGAAEYDGYGSTPGVDAGTEALLAQLDAARGQRQEIDTSDFLDQDQDELDQFEQAFGHSAHLQGTQDTSPAEVISLRCPATKGHGDTTKETHQVEGRHRNDETPQVEENPWGGQSADSATLEMGLLPGMEQLSELATPAKRPAQGAPQQGPKTPTLAPTLNDQDLDQARGREVASQTADEKALAKKKRSSKRRASVPTWDDILLGTKTH